MGVAMTGRRLRGGVSLLGIGLLMFSAPALARAGGAALGAAAESDTGTIEKMIVASGGATLDLDLQRLAGSVATGTKPASLRFDLERDSFLTALVFNGELRGPLPGSARLSPVNAA